MSRCHRARELAARSLGPSHERTPLLEVVDVFKSYRLPRPSLFAPHPLRPALIGVSFSVYAGRSFGVVGESGSGKSTLARIALALDKPDRARCGSMGARCSIFRIANCARFARTCR